MAGKIEDIPATYAERAAKNIQRTPVLPQPPNELIDTTSFVVDFAGRKSINIGLDPANIFNVSVQLITPSRHACITSDFLHRIYSLLPYILSIICDPPVKSRERLFLKDEANTLSKTTYRRENMLVIESHLQQGCRVLLNRKNLLRLQDMQWAIDESITRKSNVVRCAVMEQIDLIATYLSANVYVDKSSTAKEMAAATRNIRKDLQTKIVIPENQYSFINQIKLYANDQLAMCWAANNLQDNGVNQLFNDVCEGELMEFHENNGPTMYTYTKY